MSSNDTGLSCFMICPNLFRQPHEKCSNHSILVRQSFRNSLALSEHPSLLAESEKRLKWGHCELLIDISCCGVPHLVLGVDPMESPLVSWQKPVKLYMVRYAPDTVTCCLTAPGSGKTGEKYLTQFLLEHSTSHATPFPCPENLRGV
jgi:hypothetical protein